VYIFYCIIYSRGETFCLPAFSGKEKRMFTKREMRFLMCSQLMGMCQKSIRDNHNVILEPRDCRFLLEVLMGEKNRLSQGLGLPIEKLVDKAVDVAGSFLDGIGRELCDGTK
jgi:hypothetical protein